MKKLSRQTIYMISVPALLVVIILLVLLIALPLRNDIIGIKSDTTDARIELEKQYINGQLLKKTQEQYRLAKPRLPQLEASVLAAGQELYLITTIEELASANGLEHKLDMGDLTFPEKTEPTDTVPLALRLELNGDYENTLKFLSDLEHLDFYINWNRVNIKSLAAPEQLRQTRALPGIAPGSLPAPEGDAAASVRMVLSGHTYWRMK